MKSLVHFAEPEYEKLPEGSWRVTAPCGFVLAAPGYSLGEEYTTSYLDKLTCRKCMDLYALEILGEVP